MTLLSENRQHQNRHSAACLGLFLVCSLPAFLTAETAAPGKAQTNRVELASIEVAPAEFELRGGESLRLTVTGHYTDGSVRDVTSETEFSASDPAITTIAGHAVRAASDGQATVVARLGGRTANVTIRTLDADSPPAVSFRHQTLAALSKQGCNAGACHGSPSGKGGFRLSLRGFDAQLDELTLIREAQGRRTNLLDPESSLLLLKPLMKVAHGGGKKLHGRDTAYQILHDWIEQGCQVDAPDAPRCVGITILPGRERTLQFPAQQHLCVLAEFSDGCRRDITDLAVFSTSDPSVATVSSDGLVTAHDRGEATVIVRYLEFIESSLLTFVKEIDGFQWTAPTVRNYVDEHVYAKLNQLRYAPSEQSTDAEFVRRVYLDVTGGLPTADEAQEFLADPSPGKRSTLIDGLLDRPEHAQFWALKWGDLLRMTSSQVGTNGVHKYHRWLRRAIANNVPYDQFARELLTASGSTLENPAANFYRTAGDMNECVETISQIFLGARLQCAKCHNHPFERWTQDNYFGMGAFFHRVERKKTRRPDELFIWSSTEGEVTQPRTGEKMQPWVPVQGQLAEVDARDRRRSFAEWLTRPDNPLFAKVEVNRIWSHLLGRGIVDPPDDFRESNPPSNRELLDSLAEDFVQHGYDRKHIIRTILNSGTYQTSIRTSRFNHDESKYFSHYQPRLLSAEQLLDAICQLTGVPEKFGNLPLGTKATQLPAPDLMQHEFLKVFGQPARQTACQCERTSDANLGMAIEFLNGPLIHGKLKHPQNRLRRMVDAGKTDREIVSALHWAAVSRPASPQELAASQQHIATQTSQAAIRNQHADARLASLTAKVHQVKKEARDAILAEKRTQLPKVIRKDVLTALQTAADDRDEVQAFLAERFSEVTAATDEEILSRLSTEQRATLETFESEISTLQADRKPAREIRLAALEDICWVLLNQNEFLFNH